MDRTSGSIRSACALSPDRRSAGSTWIPATLIRPPRTIRSTSSALNASPRAPSPGTLAICCQMRVFSSRSGWKGSTTSIALRMSMPGWLGESSSVNPAGRPGTAYRHGRHPESPSRRLPFGPSHPSMILCGEASSGPHRCRSWRLGNLCPVAPSNRHKTGASSCNS